MFKAIVTDAVISKGYEGTSALRFSENGEGVRFRIGKKVYDTKAENNTRWINMNVKAFGPIVERIKKMQLKESSFINLVGRLDEESWVDQKSNETKSQFIIILDEIEYASGGGAKAKNDQNQQTTNNGTDHIPHPNNSQNTGQNFNNFSGYEPFGGGSFFDEN